MLLDLEADEHKDETPQSGGLFFPGAMLFTPLTPFITGTSALT
jgi:hypothetical protein